MNHPHCLTASDGSRSWRESGRVKDDEREWPFTQRIQWGTRPQTRERCYNAPALRTDLDGAPALVAEIEIELALFLGTAQENGRTRAVGCDRVKRSNRPVQSVATWGSAKALEIAVRQPALEAAARQLHTDGEEVIFSTCLPVMITSVGEVIARSDLASRAITISLSTIPDEARKPEAELDRLVEAARPRILGALLNAVSHGLREFSPVSTGRLPRLATFMQGAQACEGACWQPGSIQAAFEKYSADAAES